MATSAKQAEYNRRYREKQMKIRRLARELDLAVKRLEKLPECPACREARRACHHHPDARELLEKAELARNDLMQLEH